MFKSDKLPKYALRKLTVGVASVMIGMTIFSFGNPNFVKAATSNGDNPASNKRKSKSADDSANNKTLTLHTPGASTSSPQSTTASSAAKSSAAHELSAASSADLTPASSANSAAQSQSTNADSQAIASVNSEVKVDSAVSASAANSATSASSASASTAANDSTSVPASDKPLSATSKSAAKSVTLKNGSSSASDAKAAQPADSATNVLSIKNKNVKSADGKVLSASLKETTPNLDSAKVKHLGIVKLRFSTEDQPEYWWKDNIDYQVPEGYELQYKWQNFLYPMGSNPNDTNDPMNYYCKNGIIVKLVNKSTGQTVDQKLFPVITLAVKHNRRNVNYADYFNFANTTSRKKTSALTHALESGSVPGPDRQLAASPDILSKITVGDVT